MGQEMKFRFLKDQPLRCAEDFERMKFGHRDIAGALVEIVRECDTPLTIGLFGKWGSGKSSVAYCTREQLMERGAPVVIFDVWKHEGDSLKRCFLKECYEQLRKPKKNSRQNYFKTTYRLDERVEHGVTRTGEGRLRLNKDLLRQMKKIAVIGLILLAIGAGIFLKFGWLEEYRRWLFTFLTSSILVTIILNFVANVLTTERTTYSTDRLQDPYEFEKEFAKLIRALEPGKLLIIFDNLDRAPHEKALETLCTMKTFLEPADVKDTEHQIVFLIPCDDDAIKAHLREKHTMQDNGAVFDSDEFLRKFFNATLRIPKFIPSELRVFSSACLRETQVDSLDDSSIAWLITKAFRDNPRQIIQFVNGLVSTFILISSREGAGKDFEDKFFVEHTKEICLYRILTEKYPKVMTRLEDCHARSLSDGFRQQGEPADAEADDFRRFLEQVCPEVTIEDLSLFYALRRSEQEKNFPGIEQLFIYLEDNQIEQANKSGERIPNISEDPEAFNFAASTRLEGIANTTSALYFINSLLHLVNYLGVRLTRQTYSEIMSLIRTKASDRIDIIDPEQLPASMFAECPDFAPQMADLWVSHFEAVSQDEESRRAKAEYARRLIRIFRDNPNLTSPVANRLKPLLERFWVSDLELVETLVQGENSQSTLVSPGFVRGYVESLTDKDFLLSRKDTPESAKRPGKLRVLARFDPRLFDSGSLKLALTKLAAMTRTRIGKGWTPERASDWTAYFECVFRLLKKLKVKPICSAPEFNVFVDALMEAAAKIPDVDNRKVLTPFFVLIDFLGSTHRKPEREKLVTEFFEQASLPAFEYCFDQVNDTARLMQKPRYELFQRRSMKDLDFFEFFYPVLSNDQKSAWVLARLRHNVMQTVGWISKQSYEIPSMNGVLQDLLKLTAASAPREKQECFRVCNETKCLQDEGITAKYVQQLKQGLMNEDSGQQRAASDALSKADFLLEPHQRGVAKSILNWLGGLPEPKKYQPDSIRALAQLSEQLSDNEKQRFAQFCFDHLITTPKEVATITEGFDVLRQLGSGFYDSKPNLIDIQNRLRDEKDPAAKTALTRGLKDLRPAKPTRETKDFWQRVDSFDAGQ